MKKRRLALLSLCLAFVMLFAAGCGKGKNDGKYYRLSGRGEIDWDEYLLIEGSKWTSFDGGERLSGTCVIDGNSVTLRYTLTGDRKVEHDLVLLGNAGDTVDFLAGTIQDGRLTLVSPLDQGVFIYYLDGEMSGES